jgi:hypothetical protein
MNVFKTSDIHQTTGTHRSFWRLALAAATMSSESSGMVVVFMFFIITVMRRGQTAQFAMGQIILHELC